MSGRSQANIKVAKMILHEYLSDPAIRQREYRGLSDMESALLDARFF